MTWRNNHFFFPFPSARDVGALARVRAEEDIPQMQYQIYVARRISLWTSTAILLRSAIPTR